MPPVQGLNVGVIGAGFAGSAAAVMLARAGHGVTVYEAVPEPGPVGAGILLQPTGQHVLQQLGLWAPVHASGTRVDRLRCRTPSGRVLFDLPYEASARGRFGLGLHRGVLFETLFAELSRARVMVHLGTAIIASEASGHLRDAQGRLHGPHDLIIVADGARSQLRSQCFAEATDEPYPWGALWFVAEDPEGIFTRELHQVVRGTGKMTGFLPTGQASSGGVPLTSMFWSLPVAALPQWRATGLDVWKQEILSFEPRAEPLLAQIDDPEQVLFAAYRDVKAPRWHNERIVLIGDAAHAMSPQLGQGSNLALMDAQVLSQAVADAESVQQSLQLYQRRRGPHVRFYEFANRLCTPFFQGHGRLSGWLRDALFPVATALPYVRRRMVQTMCGIEQGVLRAPLSLGPGAEHSAR